MTDQIILHQKSQQSYFDQKYALYNEMEALQNWRLSITRKVLEALKPTCDDVFVDVGVGGSGYTVIMAAKMGIRSIGTDISIVGMRRAKITSSKLLTDKQNFCEFIACSATCLPFRTDSVSKIASMAVLEHIADDELAIGEFSRVLKRSGKLFINVPNSYRRIPFVFVLPYMLHDRRVGHLRHYKAENLELLFAQQGLRAEEVFYTGHLPKILQFVIQSFIGGTEKMGSHVWWYLEKLDAVFKHLPTGLQLFMLFRCDVNPIKRGKPFPGSNCLTPEKSLSGMYPKG